MQLRKLNELGIERFASFLDLVRGVTPVPYPGYLLEDDACTEVLDPRILVENRIFESRFSVAEYLYELLSQSGITGIERNRGLWAWLSLLYFEQLAPINGRGRRQPGERARWILNTSGRRYYRHLLAGPFFVYRQHADNPKRALSLLCGPVHQASDVYLEIADSPQLVTNTAVVESATRLYYDESTNKLRKGTARDKPGGARRMGKVLSQFDCTWDLYTMDADQVFELLPGEFDKFKRQWQPTLFRVE